jgi:hypothetical protein
VTLWAREYRSAREGLDVEDEEDAIPKQRDATAEIVKNEMASREWLTVTQKGKNVKC